MYAAASFSCSKPQSALDSLLTHASLARGLGYHAFPLHTYIDYHRSGIGL